MPQLPANAEDGLGKTPVYPQGSAAIRPPLQHAFFEHSSEAVSGWDANQGPQPPPNARFVPEVPQQVKMRATLLARARHVGTVLPTGTSGPITNRSKVSLPALPRPHTNALGFQRRSARRVSKLSLAPVAEARPSPCDRMDPTAGGGYSLPCGDRTEPRHLPHGELHLLPRVRAAGRVAACGPAAYPAVHTHTIASQGTAAYVQGQREHAVRRSPAALLATAAARSAAVRSLVAATAAASVVVRTAAVRGVVRESRGTAAAVSARGGETSSYGVARGAAAAASTDDEGPRRAVGPNVVASL